MNRTHFASPSVCSRPVVDRAGEPDWTCRGGMFEMMKRVVLLALLLVPLNLQAEVPETWYRDAQVNDIHFTSEHHGVAVGDHGVIWHTANGGQTWNQVPSGTQDHLQSVHFVDARYGWAVGGAHPPYSNQTRGVVLRTSDGGNTWQKLPPQSLPQLTSVRFEDSQHGWAVGAGSHIFPSGLFETNDGGRSWRSLPGSQNTHFRAVAPLPGGELLLAGEGGSISLADRGGIRKPAIQADPLRDLHAIVAAGSQQATAVGEGGLILRTENGGVSWQSLEKSPLPRTLRQVDFHAVERLGQHVWVAGSPGSLLLYSSDGGRSWERRQLPTTASIRTLFFLNETTGWAAGALGTILHTTDAGQTWQVQQQGGQRLALLGVFHDGAIVPFELISHYAGAQGYLSGIEIVNRQLPGSGNPRPAVHQAVAHSGASIGHTAWQFPSQSPQLQLHGDRLTTTWDEVNDGQGLVAAEGYLVRLIRQWRPSVILTDYADPTGRRPMAYLMNQLVLSAVDKAADDQAFPEHQAELGLEPWRVLRVGCVLPGEINGSLRLNTTQISPQLGMSLSEHATVARGILTSDVQATGSTVEVNVLRSAEFVEGRLGDLFSGISLPAGQGARRKAQQVQMVDLARLQRQAQKRRNMLEMIGHAVKQEQGGMLVLGQMLRLAEDLPKERSVEVLYHLSGQAAQQGNWTLAADVHQQIVAQHAGHPLAERSAAWLLAYYASEEMARQRSDVVEFVEPAAIVSPPDEDAVEDEPASGKIAQASFEQEEGIRLPHKASEAGVQLIGQLQRSMPQVLSDPSLAFAIERLHAAHGQSRQGEAYMRRLLNLSQDDPWSQKAQWEMVLGRGDVRLDAPITRANFATGKPVLDGHLNEAVWQGSKPLDVVSGSISAERGAPPAAAFVAYDEEFLYLAFRGKKSEQLTYVADRGEARPRDADLSDHDRVHFYLDVDRDYATYYRLSIDYRGLTRESLGQGTGWNPTWFVAARQDAESWTVEAAIPLAELSSRPPRPNTTWAFGVQRVLIGSGTQAWPETNAYELTPRDFGLLQFR